MNKSQCACVVLLTALPLLAACNREPRPSVSPVGRWEGTLTTTTGGSGTEPFTADIGSVEGVGSSYEGTFTVGDSAYDVQGSYLGANQGGDHFRFNALPAELRAAVSDPFPYGFNWSGTMTASRYTGTWSNYSYPDRELLGEGTFRLERLP